MKETYSNVQQNGLFQRGDAKGEVLVPVRTETLKISDKMTNQTGKKDNKKSKKLNQLHHPQHRHKKRKEKV
jgi:hypothetical protein